MRNEGETIRGAPTGAGGGNISGAGAGVNVNWDGAWDVKTHVIENGWIAEFMIPLRTLRYGPPPQIWGINFAAHHRAQARSGLLVAGVAHLHAHAAVVGRRTARAQCPGPARLQADAVCQQFGEPQLRQHVRRANTTTPATGASDAKIGVTSSSTLDLTYNTDFAQVEVDEQQINLTRFNLLFPEKRPFFLENRGLFAVGRPGEIDLFFSRRIGINDNGTLLPIQSAARGSPARRGGVNIGLLDMQTEDVGTRDREQLRGRPGEQGSAATDRASAPSSSTAQATGDNAGRQQLEPHLWRRRHARHRRSGHAQRFRGTHPDAGADRRQYAYNGAFDFRKRKYETQVELRGGRRRLRSAGRVPGTDRRISVRCSGAFRRHVRTPTLGQARPPRVGAARQLRELLGIRRPLRKPRRCTSTAAGISKTAIRSGPPRSTSSSEGLRDAVRGLPGGHRAGGQYRSPYFLTMGNTDRRKWISAGMTRTSAAFCRGAR